MQKTNESHRAGHVVADDTLDGVRITLKDKPHLRQSNEPYRIGSLIDKKMEEGEHQLLDMSHQDAAGRVGGPRGNARNKGSSAGHPHKVKEGEEPGSIEAQNNEEIKNSAYEDFANLIKTAVSSKLMKKKTNIKLKGHKEVVSQVLKMIELETKYLDSIITGQSADTPALQKNKAIIDMEAKKLDRMMNTVDFWPFK